MARHDKADGPDGSRTGEPGEDEAAEPDELEADVDSAIAACGGSARAAVRALLIAQTYYEAEVSRLAEALARLHDRGNPPRRPRRP